MRQYSEIYEELDMLCNLDNMIGSLENQNLKKAIRKFIDSRSSDIYDLFDEKSMECRVIHN